MIDRFIAKATLAGADVRRAAGLPAAILLIKAEIEKSGFRSLIISPDLTERAPFAEAFAGLPTALPDGALWADAGIVAADFGVAETGSVAHFDRSDGEKHPWTIPDVCFCVLEASKIVPDLEGIAPEMAAHLGRTDIPSPQVSLVTGPSRTADVENQLTIGVHGPSRLVIVLAS